MRKISFTLYKFSELPRNTQILVIKRHTLKHINWNNSKIQDYLNTVEFYKNGKEYEAQFVIHAKLNKCERMCMPGKRAHIEEISTINTKVTCKNCLKILATQNIEEFKNATINTKSR